MGNNKHVNSFTEEKTDYCVLKLNVSLSDNNFSAKYNSSACKLSSKNVSSHAQEWGTNITP